MTTDPAAPELCGCPPCPGRGNDGHKMTHCAECCFGSGVEADIDCPIHGEAAYPPTAPVPAVEGLMTEAEKASIAKAGDHHPETCDCSVYAEDGGYLDHDICTGLADTLAAVERIVAERVAAAKGELAEQIEMALHDPYERPVFIQGHNHAEPVCAWPNCNTYLTPDRMCIERLAAIARAALGGK